VGSSPKGLLPCRCQRHGISCQVTLYDFCPVDCRCSNAPNCPYPDRNAPFVGHGGHSAASRCAPKKREAPFRNPEGAPMAALQRASKRMMALGRQAESKEAKQPVRRSCYVYESAVQGGPGRGTQCWPCRRRRAADLPIPFIFAQRAQANNARAGPVLGEGGCCTGLAAQALPRERPPQFVFK
jgi:hypothetical protein